MREPGRKAAGIGNFGRDSGKHRSLPLGPDRLSCLAQPEPAQPAPGSHGSELWRHQDGASNMLGGETSSVRMPPPSPSPRSAPVYSAGGKASITVWLSASGGPQSWCHSSAFCGGAPERAVNMPRRRGPQVRTKAATNSWLGLGLELGLGLGVKVRVGVGVGARG